MKKIKKRSNVSQEVQDPELEEVEENRAFEIEEDEETNEVLFVHHYRRKWGDEFDADIEHALNYEEAGQMIGVILQIMERIQSRIMIQKATPEPIEGNPMQGSNNREGL